MLVDRRRRRIQTLLGAGEALPEEFRALRPEQLAPESTPTAVGPGVYALPLLADGVANRLLQALDDVYAHAQSLGLEPPPPNSMNAYGLIVDDVGLSPWVRGLIARRVAPVAALLFPHLASCGLDEHHAFTVDYGLGRDLDLGFHMDDSEVTLNLCLGERFEGGELYFRGERCQWHRDAAWRHEECCEVSHRPGVAYLHAGPNRHGTAPVTSGRRVNLIIWCRSRCYRERTQGSCPDWCPS